VNETLWDARHWTDERALDEELEARCPYEDGQCIELSVWESYINEAKEGGYREGMVD